MEGLLPPIPDQTPWRIRFRTFHRFFDRPRRSEVILREGLVSFRSSEGFSRAEQETSGIRVQLQLHSICESPRSPDVVDIVGKREGTYKYSQQRDQISGPGGWYWGLVQTPKLLKIMASSTWEFYIFQYYQRNVSSHQTTNDEGKETRNGRTNTK